MVTPSDIGWGGYREFEGTVYYGRGTILKPFVNPTENQKYVQVMTQTEGASYTAVNGYDSCIVSVGLFQWCERVYATSSLLGKIAEKDPHLLLPLQLALKASNASFSKNAKGNWRFFFKDARGEVDNLKEQQQLFLLHSTGLKGSWDAESKEHAKLWAACLANTLAPEEASKVQVDFCADRVKNFATPSAKAVLFDGLPSEGWVGALRCGYLSFAGNLPAVASNMLDIALKTAPGPKWSPDWCIHILKQLTFGPQIAIFPTRYNAIRPSLEALYGVNLPDFAPELQKWQADMTQGLPPAAKDEPTFFDTKEIQAFLIGIGYDLGPAGADGKMGKKSMDAIRTFQGLHGLTADGVVGPRTRAALLDEWRKVCSPT